MSRGSRRNLLLGIGAGTLALGGGTALGAGFRGSSSTGTLLRSQAPLPEAFATPLTVPPVLEPVSSPATEDVYEVTQQVAQAEIHAGARTENWGYEGRMPGTTLNTDEARK